MYTSFTVLALVAHFCRFPSRFRPSLRSVSGEQPRQPSGGGGEQIAEEEKRKSTGSISSLVRIWETSDSPPAAAAAISPSGGQQQQQAEESGSRPGSVVKFEKRVWPPVRKCLFCESRLSVSVHMFTVLTS